MHTIEERNTDLTTFEQEFPQDLFSPALQRNTVLAVVRPSLSYWQDAIGRFKKNKQSLFAFNLVIGLLVFSFLGPLLWQKDPSLQDVNNPSMAPNLGAMAVIVDENAPFEPLVVPGDHSTEIENEIANDGVGAMQGFRVEGLASTQSVILRWIYQPKVLGYVIYRSESTPSSESLGIPLTEIQSANQISFQDNQSLEARDYFYTIVPKEESRENPSRRQTIKVGVVSALSSEKAKELGVSSNLGDQVRMSPAPLGTDSLGRDILARLMAGGRVSLVIGVVASVLSVLFGVGIGGVAGFLGGSVDSILMQFTDLITGLPFLLFMILLKVVLNVGPGESGITALLISLVVLSWTGTARLVRGQILQLRNSEFVQAARLMGAGPYYLILRHMLPNLVGVILVTLTFQIPSAIFTEAFLSFIGLGVAAPATSWGSMCNDGIQSLLTRPYEFFAPAVVISLTVLAFNLLGDGLRDALDPKLRSND